MRIISTENHACGREIIAIDRHNEYLAIHIDGGSTLLYKAKGSAIHCVSPGRFSEMMRDPSPLRVDAMHKLLIMLEEEYAEARATAVRSEEWKEEQAAYSKYCELRARFGDIPKEVL